MDRPLSLLKKKELFVAGLISGTSADGIDVSLVKIKGIKSGLKIDLLGFRTYKYADSIRQKIVELCKNESHNLDDLVKLNMLLGKSFARAVIDLCKESGIDKNRLDLIGSHGQTIRHLPKVANFCGEKTRGTLQIGEPAVIAALTGSVTIGDFRPADMAVGGEGAPLCPLPHFYLFKHRTLARAVLNIGGIANITVIPKKGKMKDILAFDTGPGNILIDALVKKLYNKEYDKNGEIALRGKVNPDLLRKLKKNSYFEKKPPKSTAREDFEENLRYILKEKRISKQDVIATVAELTCRSVFSAYEKWIEPKTKIDQLVVCGGGSHNRYITKRLSMLFHPIRVFSSQELGYNPDEVEAICFAILAYLTIKSKTGNLKEVTGAKKEIRLGKICLP